MISLRENNNWWSKHVRWTFFQMVSGFETSWNRQELVPSYRKIRVFGKRHSWLLFCCNQRGMIHFNMTKHKTTILCSSMCLNDFSCFEFTWVPCSVNPFKKTSKSIKGQSYRGAKWGECIEMIHLTEKRQKLITLYDRLLSWLCFQWLE